ncbi:MAG: DUF6350 family protein [Actinomycetota bacterium]
MTEDAGRARGPLVTALVRGTLAFLGVALAGQAIAFVLYAVSGLYRPWSWVKIGLLYVLSFCGVAVDVTVPALGSAPYRVRVVLMAGSLAVAGAGYVAGRSVVRSMAEPTDRSTRDLRTAAAWGALPALPFALLAGCSSLLVSLRFPDNGIERVRPVSWEAFVLPLLVVAVAGCAGGAAAFLRKRPSRVRDAAAGGWRMFVTALLLAFAGVLVLAALEPGVTNRYARGLKDMGVGGAVLFGHHLLLLPNQSLDVLAPSMGGAAELAVQGDVTELTMGGIDAGPVIGSVAGSGEAARSVDFPPGYLLFLAIPAAATMTGGRRAARGVAEVRERASRGAAAGLVFAFLVSAGSAMATLTVSNPSRWRGHFGPRPTSTALLALAWGVAGGVLGALKGSGSQTVGETEPEADGLPGLTSA